MLQLQGRYVAKSGRTVFEPEQAALKLALEGSLEDHQKVFYCFDSKTYHLVYGEDIIFNEFEDEQDMPNIIHNSSEFEQFAEYIGQCPRFKNDEKYIQRVEKELRFFDQSNNIKFLFKLKDMIDKFKQDGVVWGVGRGSSCASLILYIMEVHDIDPVEFDIPFIELTKTDPDDPS